MDEFYSISGVIALWLGLSVTLWWLRRCWIHARQNQRIERVERAVQLLGEALPVFDAIRLSPSPKLDNAETLRTETFALLKRIQQSGEFFDNAAQLRGQLDRLTPPIECPPLAEILHIRRDLWAASEIVLADDLQRFGEAFSSEAAFERFRAEAVSLLFKRPKGGASASGKDLIDMRLNLAAEEVGRSLIQVKETVSAERERDRLPTFAEAIAYPIAAIAAIPGRLRAVKAFGIRSYGTVMAGAGAIRQSQMMARGVESLRQARQGLPQRVTAGLDRASALTRDSRKQLGKHYEFLLAAYDYQAKYEQLLRKAPELTERGKQFVTRLELAERSERLRLNSANFLIWLWRALLHGLAYAIATLQRLHLAYLEARARRSMKPQILRHLQTSNFAAASAGSLRVTAVKMQPANPPAKAVKGSGKKTREAKAQTAAPAIVEASAEASQPKKRGKKSKPAAKKANGKTIIASNGADKIPTPIAVAETSAAIVAAGLPPVASESKGGEQAVEAVQPEAETVAKPQTPSPAIATQAARAEIAAVKIIPGKPSPAAPVPQPKITPAVEPSRAEIAAKSEKPRENVKAPIAAASAAASPETVQIVPAAAALPAQHSDRSTQPAAANPDAAENNPLPVAAFPPLKVKAENPAIKAALEPMPPQMAADRPMDEPEQKRGSLFARWFSPLRGRGKNGAEQDEAALAIADIVSQVVNEANLKAEEEKFSPLLAIETLKAAQPLRSAMPTLLSKLSGIAERGETAETAHVEHLSADEIDAEDDFTEEAMQDETSMALVDDDDDMGPLTRSVMEAQAKYAAEAPQIRSFPWLRRWDNECL